MASFRRSPARDTKESQATTAAVKRNWVTRPGFALNRAGELFIAEVTNHRHSQGRARWRDHYLCRHRRGGLLGRRRARVSAKLMSPLGLLSTPPETCSSVIPERTHSQGDSRRQDHDVRRWGTRPDRNRCRRLGNGVFSSETSEFQDLSDGNRTRLREAAGADSPRRRASHRGHFQ